MVDKIRYFDHAATTAVKEEVLKEMIPYFGMNFGNASSAYGIGRVSHRAIEDARRKVARAIGAKPNEIYFTSCGSESDNLAIKGIAYQHRTKGNHIITTKIEHPAVLHTCKALERQGFEVTYLKVDEMGRVSLRDLENAIKPSTILISVMFANNEIGTIQPIGEIAHFAKQKKVYFHTDAVQAVGNVAINVKQLGVDLLSMSAHKFYGPKGVGALYVREGVTFEKIQDGGHQEKDKRAGTENVAGIVGMGKAIELAHTNLQEYAKRMSKIRDYYLDEVSKKITGVKVNGDPDHRLPGNANVSFEGLEGEAILYELDKKGICASAGSACSTGLPEPSHVLTSIGLPSNLANGTIRITFGEDNTKEDVDFLVQALVEIVGRLRRAH